LTGQDGKRFHFGARENQIEGTVETKSKMNRPTWFLDELAHAGSEHIDANYATTYDHKAGADPTADVELLRQNGLNKTHTLIDFGAGTGTFALAAAPYCQQVIAVDVSPAMLAILYEKAVRQGITNIQCVQSGFLSYDHQGKPAEFVYSRNALHHLPDLWKAIALERIARLMPSAGLFRLRDFIFAFEPSDTEESVEGWLAGAVAHSDSGWTRAELETHLRTEYSTFTWLLEPMLERAGLTIREAKSIETKVYTSYLCVKQ
jgi:ubiquinone/menaquinone biosynthesis C-methylase UbiE